MPISSVILEVKKNMETTVAESLKDVPCLEVGEIGIGHLIVMTDTQRVQEDRALCESLSKWPNVITANVVFTNMEDCIEEL